jgi:hypothetical protein
LTLAIDRIEPRVVAETFNFLSVGEGVVHVSATVRYTILYAGVTGFRVRIPKGATAVNIEGPNLKHKEKDANDPTTWTVLLHTKQTGSYSLFISFQHEMEEKASELQYAGVQAIDAMTGTAAAARAPVQRETGYIAIAARSDIEAQAPKFKNLMFIYEREIT